MAGTPITHQVTPLAIFHINADPSPQPAPPDKTQVKGPNPGISDVESLTLPMVSEEMSRLASELTKNFEHDPQFASSEVPPDRDRVIVHWHGAQSAGLSRLLSGHASTPVEVRQTKFLPGMLRQRASQLAATDADVHSYGINYDGSGLKVSVSTDGANGNSELELGRKYERQLRVPVKVNIGGRPQPAAETRQFDRGWHLGGARIYDWGSSGTACTSGFAVVKNGTTEQGTMFAAHCARNSVQWTAWDGGPYYYAWGAGGIAATDYPHDGAIIKSSYSYPFIWTGAWNSSVYEEIKGDAYPFVGQELCYSGSYSGIKCGNIVKDTTYDYTFEGYPTTISGFRTEQSNSDPAVGNGDSGGPGYQLVGSPSGAKRLAVGIISGMPNGAGTSCQGVPGSETGRRCSHIALATPVATIGIATGWHIPAS
jgi:hypothetical protein